MPEAPSLAIVIVSYNVRDDLDACLRSLANCAARFPTRIAVVDNGSSDGTVQMLRERWPHVDLVETGSNLGFARASNVGIRRTRGEFVLLLNPDTLVTPGAVGALVAALVARPEAAAAGPRLIDGQGRAELSFGWAVSPTGELRQKILMSLSRQGLPLMVRTIDRWTRTPGPREWLSGACLLLRRSDLEAVGLLDERYFMYYEDVDLCVALRRRGRTILFVPEAQIEHLRGRSGASNAELEQRRRDSQMAYYRKHHPQWAPLLAWYLRLRARGCRR